MKDGTFENRERRTRRIVLREEIMKINHMIVGVGIAGAIALVGLSATAFAWHPKGGISKKVQNITSTSLLSEADTATQAVIAKPGDILKYVIEIRNDGTADSKGYNDMANTVLTDMLPAGVELVDTPAQRQITETLGLLKPGQKVTREYMVKVTATTDMTIVNTACFTGDSTANDNPQKGCNDAVIEVTVPEVPVVTTPETPTETTPELPLELPQTGVTGSAMGAAFVVGLGVYATYRYLASRRELIKTLMTRR